MRNACAGSFTVPCPPPIKGNTVLTQVREAQGTGSVWPCRDHMSTGPPRHPCSFDRQGPPRCPALHGCSVRGVVQLTCHSSLCSAASTPASSLATLLSLIHLYSYRSQSHLCKRKSRQVTPPPKSTQWPSITPNPGLVALLPSPCVACPQLHLGASFPPRVLCILFAGRTDRFAAPRRH